MDCQELLVGIYLTWQWWEKHYQAARGRPHQNLAANYLKAVTDTMCHAYKVVSDLFGPIDGFPIGNRNVTMISPDLYV